MAMEPSWGAEKLFNAPLKQATGVRTALTMTTSYFFVVTMMGDGVREHTLSCFFLSLAVGESEDICEELGGTTGSRLFLLLS
jgi:hypothetical protein